jgi:hypothetical protein
MTVPVVASPEARYSPTGLLRESIRLMRANPRATILPMAVIQVPLTILIAVASFALYATVFSGDPYPTGGIYGVSEMGRPLFAMVLILAVNGLFAFVAQGATTIAIAGAAQGRPTNVSESLDPAFTRMGSLVGLAIMLIAGTVVLAFSIVGIALLPFFALRMGLAINALMLENLTPLQALGRSWRLMKGNMFRLLGALILTGVIVFIPLLIVQTLGLLAADSGRTTRMIADTLLSIVDGVIAVPFVVLPIAVTTLFYLDLKAKNDVRNPS